MSNIPHRPPADTGGEGVKMNRMRENENKYDVIIDDGGRIYKMEFIGAAMTEQEIIDDFLDGYDGEISEAELDIVFV